MIIKNLLDEDFVQYKKPTMTISTSRCSFKCDELNGCHVCQNSELIFLPDIEINNKELIKRYMNNPITEAICFSGLEVIDQFSELISFIKDFREISDDDIVIYTGYTEEELEAMGCIDMLKHYHNILIKVGRYIMNCEPHYDELLGVKLASPNQYAVRIS